MLEAIGRRAPLYAHLPLLHGPDGKKLSKRHGAASVQELRDAGYLPEAVRNYLALLGWGDDDETTFHTHRRARGALRLERVSKNPAAFDEQKLRWMNGRYMRELTVERADRAARGATPAGAACATPSRSRARRSRPSRTSGRSPGSSSTGPADDPAAREKWLGADGGAGAARRTRRARRPSSRSASRGSSRRCRASSSGGAASRKRGLPAAARRARRARRCRPGSSRRSRCWAATSRCGGSTRRWLDSAAQRQERQP